jgi:hypothetical protein
LFGLDIHNLTMDETLRAIGEIMERKKFVFAITPNVDHMMKYRKSAQFRALYKKPGWWWRTVCSCCGPRGCWARRSRNASPV